VTTSDKIGQSVGEREPGASIVPIGRPFVWTKQRTRAAELVADGDLADEAIATALGCARSTLAVWRTHPEFVERVAESVAAYRAAVLARGIARQERRIAAADDRHRRMQRVIEARAGDPTMADVPGGTEGLLVRQYRTVGRGDDAEVVEQYAIDTGLLREMRAHEEQVAKELGQWIEKSDLTSGGQPLRREYVGVEVGDV